jgi:hypothetical protein
MQKNANVPHAFACCAGAQLPLSCTDSGAGSCDVRALAMPTASGAQLPALWCFTGPNTERALAKVWGPGAGLALASRQVTLSTLGLNTLRALGPTLVPQLAGDVVITDQVHSYKIILLSYYLILLFSARGRNVEMEEHS